MTQLYLFLSYICVQCYIGPCGVLVPTGRVHSNNEFVFELYVMGSGVCAYRLIILTDKKKVSDATTIIFTV